MLSVLLNLTRFFETRARWCEKKLMSSKCSGHFGDRSSYGGDVAEDELNICSLFNLPKVNTDSI